MNMDIMCLISMSTSSVTATYLQKENISTEVEITVTSTSAKVISQLPSNAGKDGKSASADITNVEVF